MSLTAQRSISGRAALLERFHQVREASLSMCATLEPAEFRLQPIDDVSPPWWNLGHTSWFFARNVLVPFGGETTAEDKKYDYLLNSYYASIGERLPRGKRGSVSRPTTDEIYAYRASVDERIEHLLETIDDDQFDDMAFVFNIGLQHEQQHQELFFTEIKYILAQNIPQLRRAYHSLGSDQATKRGGESVHWLSVDGGLVEIGNMEGGWCWDNELPVHKYFLLPFQIADRLVTNAEYLEFMGDGGYSNPLLWLDNGWQQCVAQHWQAPLYWERVDGQWWQWTLHGMQRLKLNEPVCHVSFYETDAFARWRSETFAADRGVRLPNEHEWEHAARALGSEAAGTAFLDSGRLHPQAENTAVLREMSGVLWQWTSSYYEPYPGYRPFPGVLAEYNGKFMDNQRVLRGGSCVTPCDHYRISYRNFWPATTRFQFTGIRLARDVKE